MNKGFEFPKFTLINKNNRKPNHVPKFVKYATLKEHKRSPAVNLTDCFRSHVTTRSRKWHLKSPAMPDKLPFSALGPVLSRLGKIRGSLLGGKGAPTSTTNISVRVVGAQTRLPNPCNTARNSANMVSNTSQKMHTADFETLLNMCWDTCEHRCEIIR
jgi:hypothetical protein